MKAFFGQMNQGREPDRIGKWMSHRQEIKYLIENSLGEFHAKDEAIILGAGNCDDLDLDYLAARFNRVTLADIDNDSMQVSVNGLDPQLQLRIKCLDSLDFTGLDQIDFYARFQNLLDQQASAAQLAAFLQEASAEVVKKPVLAQYKKRYTAVISSAVHTQLFYLHALSMFAIYAKLYVKNDVKRIVEGIAALRDIILRQYNEMLFALARSDGAVVMWTDIILLDTQTEFIKESIYALSNEEKRAQFMLRLMGSYGIDSAVLALQDMHDKMAVEGKLLRSWVWPFSAEKQFITVGISGRAKVKQD
jgi:hypothetical protein